MGLFDNLFKKKKAEEPAQKATHTRFSYVVLDFETNGLSPRNDEIIEIGAARYINGIPAGTFSTFVKPKNGISTEITDLTGIRYTDVKEAPTISNILPSLVRFIGSDPIVAHNAAFDIQFLSYALAREGLSMNNVVFDTLAMARAAFPGQSSYKLSALKENLNIVSPPSHRALADVLTTAILFNRCIPVNPHFRPCLMSDLCGCLDADELTPIKSLSHCKACDFSPSVDPASMSPNCPLFGKVVVFTGKFDTPLAEMMQAAVDVGATLWDRVTLKTDYLIEGTQDPSIVGQGGFSEKQLKARQYNAEGKKEIIIISENEFFQLINS